MFYIGKIFCFKKINCTEITLKIKFQKFFYTCCPPTEHLEKIYVMHIERVNLEKKF
jgi:hypothetical protein